MKSLILLCTLLSSTAYSQVGVVGGGTLTNGAIVTGGGNQLIQTSCSSCTLNASGDLTIPGILSVGTNSTINGNLTLGSGTMLLGPTTTFTANGMTLFSFDPRGSQGGNLFLGGALLNCGGTCTSPQGTGNYTLSPAGGGSYLASNNTAVGFNSLRSLTTGYSNASIGVFGLQYTTTGYDNANAGLGGLQFDTIGHNNANVGTDGLWQNTTGNFNTNAGDNGLSANRSGVENSNVGHDGLLNNQTGSYNVNVGDYGQYHAVSGSSNTSVGAYSLYNTTGQDNVAVGYAAGFWETGSNTLYVDNQPRANLSAERSQALMYGIFGSTPAQQYLTLNANVGIGTRSPATTLEVNGTAKFYGAVTFAPTQTFPGTITGASTGSGLQANDSTMSLITSCANGQVLTWNGSGWQCGDRSSSGITGVTAGVGLTGGGTSGKVTLNLDTTEVPQLATANSFTNSQTVTATDVGITALQVEAADTTAANTAIQGVANGPNAIGVSGQANNGSTAVGVLGISNSGLAGEFKGNVSISGNLSRAGGSFKIDDPVDPENKYLYHSSVESPDMKNIYDGVAVLDANGETVIQLPDWFQALNRDFRYQLTCIGGFAPVYISQEVSNNQFSIAGGKAGMRVSWQVTGIREDPWANANRIPVEQEKTVQERGYYLHPELYNAPPDGNVFFIEHTNMAKIAQ
jgi:hypothetical protein